MIVLLTFEVHERAPAFLQQAAQLRSAIETSLKADGWKTTEPKIHTTYSKLVVVAADIVKLVKLAVEKARAESKVQQIQASVDYVFLVSSGSEVGGKL